MSKGRIILIVLFLGVVVAVLAVRYGAGSKDVVIDGPTESERAAELGKMTPEQREAAEAMLDAVRSQAQSTTGEAPPQQ